MRLLLHDTCLFLSTLQLVLLCIPDPLDNTVTFKMLRPRFRQTPNQQGHGVSSHCTAAEMMGLLGRKLGGGGSALIAGAEAIPLLNEAWQVCFRQGCGGVGWGGDGRRQDSPSTQFRGVGSRWPCSEGSDSSEMPVRKQVPVGPGGALTAAFNFARLPSPSLFFACLSHLPFPERPLFSSLLLWMCFFCHQEIAPAPLDVYMEGAAAWLGVLLRCPAYGPDEVSF